ncbi:MAG: hypothetical protein ACU0CT_03475 [Paracoccaceae bacterium]
MDEYADYDVDALYLADERYDSATTLYRYFCGDDLLYVGITNCFSRRDAAHFKKAPEWRVIADRVDLELFPTTYLAECAEKKAIAEEKPEYNALRLAPNPPSRVSDRWYIEKMGGLVGEFPKTVQPCSVPDNWPFWQEPTLEA